MDGFSQVSFPAFRSSQLLGGGVGPCRIQRESKQLSRGHFHFHSFQCRKPSEPQGKQIRFLKRTMVEKNGESTPRSVECREKEHVGRLRRDLQRGLMPLDFLCYFAPFFGNATLEGWQTPLESVWAWLPCSGVAVREREATKGIGAKGKGKPIKNQIAPSFAGPFWGWF